MAFIAQFDHSIFQSKRTTTRSPGIGRDSSSSSVVAPVHALNSIRSRPTARGRQELARNDLNIPVNARHANSIVSSSSNHTSTVSPVSIIIITTATAGIQDGIVPRDSIADQIRVTLSYSSVNHAYFHSRRASGDIPSNRSADLGNAPLQRQGRIVSVKQCDNVVIGFSEQNAFFLRDASCNSFSVSL